jgi:hypothetical protein
MRTNCRLDYLRLVGNPGAILTEHMYAMATYRQSASIPRQPLILSHCSLAYSALASLRIWTSGSASFQMARKS